MFSKVEVLQVNSGAPYSASALYLGEILGRRLSGHPTKGGTIVHSREVRCENPRRAVPCCRKNEPTLTTTLEQ